MRSFGFYGTNAVQVNVTVFGILCGLTGMIAGIFEINQGNIPVQSFRISMIGDSYPMFDRDSYLAYSLYPNYLVTGIMAVITGSAVITWSIFFIQRKFGGLVFLVLSILQLLSGGGFVIDLAAVTIIISLGIHSNLGWWKKIQPPPVGKFLAASWPWALLVFCMLSAVLLILPVIGTASEKLQETIVVLAGLLFIPILLMIFGGFAHNIKYQIS